MADYHSPTVVQPLIPVADMTPLELLILTLVLDCEEHEGQLYLFSEIGPSDIITLSLEKLIDAFEQSLTTVGSTANIYIASKLPKDGADESERPDSIDIDIDMSGTSFEFLLQDIVKRSPTLAEIVVTTSFTCTKMRPDGFGGSVVLITADAIKGKSTNDMLDDLRNDIHAVEVNQGH